MESIAQLPCHSAFTGKLSASCVHCKLGAELVLFVVGVCHKRCYYCPISEHRRGSHETYANERLVRSDEDVLDEARLIGARGTGITGGDPLDFLDRTIHYIRLLKGAFGPKHNIHLYTASYESEKVRALAEAGLDEIRFHPATRFWSGLERSPFAEAIAVGRESGLVVGNEVPAIPGEEEPLRELIRSAARLGVAYLNLNELEFSETNWHRLEFRGFRPKSDISHGVAGSEELALRLVREEGQHLPVHYCSSGFKDRVQLGNRLKRRAERIARPLDVITDEGTLLRGIVEGENLASLARTLRDTHAVPAELLVHNPAKARLEVAPWVLEELAPTLEGHPCWIVEEYPTTDALEVERWPVRAAPRRR